MAYMYSVLQKFKWQTKLKLSLLFTTVEYPKSDRNVTLQYKKLMAFKEFIQNFFFIPIHVSFDFPELDKTLTISLFEYFAFGIFFNRDITHWVNFEIIDRTIN